MVHVKHAQSSSLAPRGRSERLTPAPTLRSTSSPAALGGRPGEDRALPVRPRTEATPRPVAPVGVGAATSAFSAQCRALSTSNRFAVLEGGDAVDAALTRAEAARGRAHAARGYTLPKPELFGTDVPHGGDAVKLLGAALDAGYRAFDAASSYESLESLAAAARARGLSSEALYVIYKVKPADDRALDRAAARGTPGASQASLGKVSAQLESATRALGRTPDVLVLHELADSDAANQATLVQLAAEVKAGRAKGVGVSNVSLEELRGLWARSRALGVPLKCVENRFSPYHRDEAVRRFCAAHDIRYVAYGLMGSAQKGACVGEGWGDPAAYLLARRDPRLVELARTAGVTPGELLVAWSYAKGAVPIAFSTDAKRIAENHGARRNDKISAAVLAEADRLFLEVGPERERALAARRLPETLTALYAAERDPTAWHILDVLTADPQVAALLAGASSTLAGAADHGEAARVRRNLVKNLERHVADLQSAGLDDWRPAMLEPLKEVAAAAAARPEVAARFAAWASKDSTHGGGFVDATTAFPAMLAPPPAAADAPRTLAASEHWTVFADVDCEALVAAPVPGETYTFFRMDRGEPELLTGALLAADAHGFQVRPAARSEAGSAD